MLGSGVTQSERIRHSRWTRRETKLSNAETSIALAARPRALYDDQLMLKREIHPAIGAMKADEVSKRDVIRILDGVADRGARVRSNRVFALLRSIYRWGLAEDLIKSDPTQGVRPRTFERPRDRVLTDAEVNIFWHSLDGAPMTKAVATILRLALVTGQRIGEIAGMTQAEVDLSVANPCGRRQVAAEFVGHQDRRP